MTAEERALATVKSMLLPEMWQGQLDEMLPVILSPYYQPILDGICAAVAEALEKADLTCESHPGYRLVWCNECVKIDREAWQKRVAEEREASAMVAEGWEPSVGGLTNPVYAANSIATAIRARGAQS